MAPRPGAAPRDWAGVPGARHPRPRFAPWLPLCPRCAPRWGSSAAPELEPTGALSMGPTNRPRCPGALNGARRPRLGCWCAGGHHCARASRPGAAAAVSDPPRPRPGAATAPLVCSTRPRLGCLPWCRHRAAGALHRARASAAALVGSTGPSFGCRALVPPPRRWCPPPPPRPCPGGPPCPRFAPRPGDYHRRPRSAAAPCLPLRRWRLPCARASGAAALVALSTTPELRALSPLPPWCPPPRPRFGCPAAGGAVHSALVVFTAPGVRAVSADAPWCRCRALAPSPVPELWLPRPPGVRAVVATTAPDVCAAGGPPLARDSRRAPAPPPRRWPLVDLPRPWCRCWRFGWRHGARASRRVCCRALVLPPRPSFGCRSPVPPPRRRCAPTGPRLGCRPGGLHGPELRLPCPGAIHRARGLHRWRASTGPRFAPRPGAAAAASGGSFPPELRAVSAAAPGTVRRALASATGPEARLLPWCAPHRAADALHRPEVCPAPWPRFAPCLLPRPGGASTRPSFGCRAPVSPPRPRFAPRPGAAALGGRCWRPTSPALRAVSLAAPEDRAAPCLPLRWGAAAGAPPRPRFAPCLLPRPRIAPRRVCRCATDAPHRPEVRAAPWCRCRALVVPPRAGASRPWWALPRR